MCLLFFQAEDGIRDLVRSRGLGDVYKRQDKHRVKPGTMGYLAYCSALRYIGEARRFVLAVDVLSLIHI